MALRKAGFSIRQIAEQLREPRSTIYDDLRKALHEEHVATQGEVEDLRALWYLRLEEMHKSIWQKAINGNLGAIDRALKICEQESKLFGLYMKPERIRTRQELPPEPEPDMTEEEVEARIMEIIEIAKQRKSAAEKSEL